MSPKFTYLRATPPVAALAWEAMDAAGWAKWGVAKENLNDSEEGARRHGRCRRGCRTARRGLSDAYGFHIARRSDPRRDSRRARAADRRIGGVRWLRRRRARRCRRAPRLEERRVGKGWVGECSSRWWRSHKQE